MDLKKVAMSPIGVGIQAGLVALYPIGRAPRVVQGVFVALPAAAGALAAVRSRTSHKPRGPRIAAAVGAATSLAAAQLVALMLNRTAERLVRRMNVPAPRLAVAVGAGIANAGLSIALNRWIANRRPARSSREPDKGND
jgi:hypothetical protein